MKKEGLRYLALHLPARDFILVYMVQREEYFENRRMFAPHVTQRELEHFFPDSKPVRLALYRLQEEGLIKKSGFKVWSKIKKVAHNDNIIRRDTAGYD